MHISIDTSDRTVETSTERDSISIGCKTFGLKEFRARLRDLAKEENVGEQAVQEYFHAFDIIEFARKKHVKVPIPKAVKTVVKAANKKTVSKTA